MKEIVVLAGLLGVVFVFLWSIIFFLELFIKKKKEKRMEGKTGDMVPLIVAGIAAYEEEEGETKKRGEMRRGKSEAISWWRVSGRVK